MALSKDQLQQLVNADPAFRQALAAFTADSTAYGGSQQQQRAIDPVHMARTNQDPQNYARYANFNTVIKDSPLQKALLAQDLQVNPATGQVEPRHNAIEPNTLALLIGGGLVTGGLLSGATAGGSASSAAGGSSAPTLEGVAAGGSGSTAIPSAATSVLADTGPSIVPATAGSQVAAEGAYGAAGGGGILGTAGKLVGFNKDDPNSYLKLAGAVGGALGAAGQGAAQGRLTQTELNQRQDALAQQQYQNQLTAPGKIAGNSVRGDILSNARDFSYGAPTMVGNIPVPTSSGGLRPSIFSDNTRQLGARQSADALAMPGPPSLTPMDTAGAGSSILNAAGAVGSFADLLNPNNYTSKIPYKRPVQGQGA